MYIFRYIFCISYLTVVSSVFSLLPPVLRVQWESREWGQDVHTYWYTNIERKGIIRFGHLFINLLIYSSVHQVICCIHLLISLYMHSFICAYYVCPKSRCTDSCFSNVSHDLEFMQILSYIIIYIYMYIYRPMYLYIHIIWRFHRASFFSKHTHTHRQWGHILSPSSPFETMTTEVART